LLLGAVLVWYAVLREGNDKLLVAFLDVREGDAIFIEAPNGNQVLIDGGPNKRVLNELSRVMPFYDRSIDVVIASHPDKDHIGGLVEVLKRFKVGILMEPGVGSDTAAYKALTTLATKEKIKKILARSGMRIVLGDGLHFDVLFPPRGPNVGEMENNTASIVARLVYGNNSFLFTADSPKAVEIYLANAYKQKIQSDVLKVGHHGSDSSTSEFFLGYVKPEYAVISVGANNKYGHPHEAVLKRLSDFSISVLRTDKLGTIRFRSDGKNFSLF
jgi:competence protein ComEC